jgi:tRNA(Ile)-lysidine synthetase-like protein
MLRSRRPGDCIRTAQGRKSVKKLLSELKIPSEARELVPVLQGEDETIAVLAGPFGGKTVQGIPSCQGQEPITLSIQISKIPTSGEVCE